MNRADKPISLFESLGVLLLLAAFMAFAILV